jgi:hypothetical protein
MRPALFLDPAFGVLTLVSGFWVGRAKHESGDVRFMVVGNDLGPDIALLESARSQIQRFNQVEREALGFLCGEEPEARFVEEFAFVSIDFLRPDRPENFEVEFLSEDFRFWLVEFESARPRYSGWFFEMGSFAPHYAKLGCDAGGVQSKLRDCFLKRLSQNLGKPPHS